MRALIPLLILMLISAHAVAAQTATPTPTPEPLLLKRGYVAAESPALQAAYTGAGWAVLVDGAHAVMTGAAGDLMALDVEGAQIVIYRDLWPDGGAASVCIDDQCAIVDSAASVEQRAAPVAFAIPGGRGTLTITPDGELRIDGLLVVAADPLSEVPAPDPARDYITLADGTTVAIDRALSVEGVLIIALLAALIVVSAVGVIGAAWTR